MESMPHRRNRVDEVVIFQVDMLYISISKMMSMHSETKKGHQKERKLTSQPDLPVLIA